MTKYETPLVKRTKSFLWRAGMMGVAAALAWAADNVGLLELSPSVTVVLGLILGEVSKHFNNTRG